MPYVLDGHDLAVLRGGGDPELERQPRAGDDARVVPRRLEGSGEAREQAAIIVLNARGLPVHRPPGAHNPRSVCRADALVAEADAEDRRRGPEAPNHVRGDPRFPGRTGPRRDDDVGGPESLDLLVRRGVVASYNSLFPQLPYVPG